MKSRVEAKANYHNGKFNTSKIVALTFFKFSSNFLDNFPKKNFCIAVLFKRKLI